VIGGRGMGDIRGAVARHVAIDAAILLVPGPRLQLQQLRLPTGRNSCNDFPPLRSGSRAASVSVAAWAIPSIADGVIHARRGDTAEAIEFGHGRPEVGCKRSFALLF
jgi:hypothetical protein